MISADLGPQLERFVAKLVETGRYNSKSEELREGIRLLQERETRLSVLDQSLARGLADAEAGRVKPHQYQCIAKGDQAFVTCGWAAKVRHA